MKKWIAKHWVTIISVPVAGLVIALCLFVLFLPVKEVARNLNLWRYMVTLPEPEQCALCTDKGIVWTYPCWVKLETGEIGEIQVDGNSATSVTLPKKPMYINPGLFCRDCRAKIGEIIGGARIYSDGYILADLYDLENIQLYPVTDGAAYDILGCTVEVTKEKAGLTVTVTGYVE